LGVTFNDESASPGIADKQFLIVSTASSYNSASDRRVIAGLGPDPVAKRVVIRWPSGLVRILANVKGDRMLDVQEPKQ
jgi:hypothetical protein